MATPLEQNLSRYVSRAIAQLRRDGHATPEVAVSSMLYRIIVKHCGPVQGGEVK